MSMAVNKGRMFREKLTGLENGDIVLIRGGDLDPDILRADAARYYSIYGVPDFYHRVGVRSGAELWHAGLRTETGGFAH